MIRPSKSSTPPFLRIAAELQQRIAAGELRPGERIPSTRQVAATYGVAIATATKALGALVQAGVAEAVPRIGTVVAGSKRSANTKLPTRRGSRRLAEPTAAKAHAGLDEAFGQRIVDTAIVIADEQGLPALSMRGVASKLGVPTMSLYRHVPSKEQLVLRITDAALSEQTFPTERPPGFRAQLELAARLQWAVFRRHPWLARVLTLTRPLPLASTLVYADWVLAAIDGLGLDLTTMLYIHVTLHSFVQGLAVNLESEAQAEAETGITDEEHMEREAAAFRALAASGKYKTFGKVAYGLSEGFAMQLDTLFEFGLQPLLDGFVLLIERAGTQQTKR